MCTQVLNKKNINVNVVNFDFSNYMPVDCKIVLKKTKLGYGIKSHLNDFSKLNAAISLNTLCMNLSNLLLLIQIFLSIKRCWNEFEGIFVV